MDYNHDAQISLFCSHLPDSPQLSLSHTPATYALSVLCEKQNSRSVVILMWNMIILSMLGMSIEICCHVAKQFYKQTVKRNQMMIDSFLWKKNHGEIEPQVGSYFQVTSQWWDDEKMAVNNLPRSTTPTTPVFLLFILILLQYPPSNRIHFRR